MHERNMLEDLMRIANAYHDGLVRIGASPEVKQFAEALAELGDSVRQKMEDPETRKIIENGLRNFAKLAKSEDESAAMTKLADDIASINHTSRGG